MILTTCTEMLSKKSLFLHHLPGSLLKRVEQRGNSLYNGRGTERGKEEDKITHLLKTFTCITIHKGDKQQNLKVRYLG